MILAACRFVFLVCVASLTLSAVARANPMVIAFTAMIGSSNDIDTDNVFGEGAGANSRVRSSPARSPSTRGP
jgi:hypothetical protein